MYEVTIRFRLPAGFDPGEAVMAIEEVLPEEAERFAWTTRDVR